MPLQHVYNVAVYYISLDRTNKKYSLNFILRQTICSTYVYLWSMGDYTVKICFLANRFSHFVGKISSSLRILPYKSSPQFLWRQILHIMKLRLCNNILAVKMTDDIKVVSFLFLIQTKILGTGQNPLIEMVLTSTQNLCLE